MVSSPLPRSNLRPPSSPVLPTPCVVPLTLSLPLAVLVGVSVVAWLSETLAPELLVLPASVTVAEMVCEVVSPEPLSPHALTRPVATTRAETQIPTRFKVCMGSSSGYCLAPYHSRAGGDGVL
ncbi:hypothetical protein [Nannocystis sp.]|uniref:hypothetical protein n=1 Tax=Nannocystis sp. TaxID=1962667 RepID=UPI0025D2EE92|nr:hypothetical protein [Nannocystis sp.]MBK7829247.1 hypothetical protein [Nannocystis sp.]